MMIKINGMPLAATVNQQIEMNPSVGEVVVAKWGNKKLKQMAISLWTLSGVMLSRAAEAGFYEQMKPLLQVFQEMALGFGSLAIIAGLVLMVVKKRWGTLTLQMTAVVVLGIFLAPSILMLIAIVGTYLNDGLYQAFKEVWKSKPVMGGGE
jgi:hypothetical protein